MTRVREIMSARPVEGAPDLTVREVAALMIDRVVGAVVLHGPLDDVALVSERDVLLALSEGADPDEALAAEVASTDLAYLTPEDTLDDAIRSMADHWVRHLPVLDEDGRVCGMVSARDVLLALAG